MPNNTDWLPRDRTGQLNMAKGWLTTIQSRGSGWGVSNTAVQDLTTAISNAEAIYQTANSADRTHTVTTECNRLFGELVKIMRFTKDRFFKNPPLVDEDYTALLLKVPDTTRTPRPRWTNF